MEPDWGLAADFIGQWEAFISYPYDDAQPSRRVFRGECSRVFGQYMGPAGGTVTIGFGETDADFIDQHWGGVSYEAALNRKAERLKGFWAEGVRQSGLRTEHLNPNQASAWVSLFYNSGSSGPASLAPMLVELSNDGLFDLAARLWRTSIIMVGTQYESGLRRRRAAEAELFLEPYQHSNIVPFIT